MGFLKGISPYISPDLLHALACMGHGDEIVLADAHFPAHSIAKSADAKMIRADGINVPCLLDAILRLINLDTYVTSPVMLMALTQQDQEQGEPPIWKTFTEIVNKHAAASSPVKPVQLERFQFYERAKKATVIVQTGETAKYGNIILTNGLVVPEHEKKFWEHA